MIVVAGEALVDLVPDTATVGRELPLLAPRLGGGPYNVAVSAGRLGAPTAFLSRISEDHFGEALLARLRAAAVDTTLLQRGPEPTTLAVVGLGVDGSARYTFHAHGTADRLFTDPGVLPEQISVLSLGTLSLVLEPGASGYETVLRRAAADGVLTVLDPNIRAALIDDAAAYRARFESWLPDLGLLKMSEEDARWLADLPSGELSQALTGWLSKGPAAVVLTRGGAGLAAVTSSSVVEVPATPSTVVDTIGAGDTVHGALLAWLHGQGVGSVAEVRALAAGDWREALGFAAAAAAVTVSRAGAEPPYSAELV
ncbi:MAG: carbohydrate kinase family protein [Sciscionella sp.]